MATGAFELEKNRVEALSDGIFAIAMTILVLSVKIPELPADTTNVQLLAELSKLGTSVGAYVVAFVSLGVFWVLHHMVYHAVRVANRTLLWLSIMFFLVISMLPLSVQIMSAFPRANIGAVIFGANLAMVGWLLLFQWKYALSQSSLSASHVTQGYKEAIGTRLALLPVVSTITTLVCFWSVATSMAIYCLLLPFYFTSSAHERDLDERAMARYAFFRRALGVGAIAALFVGWYLFRPELLLVNQKVNEAALKGSQRLLEGSFSGLAHPTKGTAVIERKGDKDYLRFTDFSTSNGPDVHVYLVAAPEAKSDDVVRHAGFINLGKMKGNQGDQNYELPPMTNLTQYRSVSLWCERFNVNFGSAALR